MRVLIAKRRGGQIDATRALLRPLVSSSSGGYAAPTKSEARSIMTNGARDTVVFDLGGVLIDWDPRHLYRKLFAGDEAAMEDFLAAVCTHEWNRCQDAGRS